MGITAGCLCSNTGRSRKYWPVHILLNSYSKDNIKKNMITVGYTKLGKVKALGYLTLTSTIFNISSKVSSCRQ